MSSVNKHSFVSFFPILHLLFPLLVLLSQLVLLAQCWKRMVKGDIITFFLVPLLFSFSNVWAISALWHIVGPLPSFELLWIIPKWGSVVLPAFSHWCLFRCFQLLANANRVVGDTLKYTLSLSLPSLFQFSLCPFYKTGSIKDISLLTQFQLLTESQRSPVSPRRVHNSPPDRQLCL